MNDDSSAGEGRFLHVVSLDYRDEEHARRCIAAVANCGSPDALAYGCVSYEFGVRDDAADTVCIVERWRRWQDLDALLAEKVVPAPPTNNRLLKKPFDPARDTVRINLSGPI